MNSSNESDKYSNCYNEDFLSPAGWHTLVIPDTQEAEIKKITVQSQSQVNSLQDLISKKTHHKTKRGGLRVAQEVEQA